MCWAWTLPCMASFLPPVVTGDSSSAARLRVAAAAYLARYRGLCRDHTGSDLRVFLVWCAERDLDPLAAQRAHLELSVRWCQEVRRFKPSTVSRRTSVVCGLPHLRHRRAAGALPGAVAAPPHRPGGVTHPRLDPPAVRGAAEHGPRVDQPQRLRPGRHARPARVADLRGPAPPRSPTSARSTPTGCCGWSARAPRSCGSRCRPR